MTEEELIRKCKKYGILKCIINDDMSIDVNGNVGIPGILFDKFPFTFQTIKGDFECDFNRLKTLEGCPDHVDGYFSCKNNHLSTLEYCPSYVGEDFSCSYNCLTTLKHLPVNFYVGGNFYCKVNSIKEAKEFSKLFFGHIGGDIYTDKSVLTEFLNENKNPPKKDLPRLLSELRKITL